MVKVKEFCCGCTLRTGTLILAWSAIVWNCIFFLNDLLTLFLRLRRNSLAVSPYSSIYFMAERIIAIAVSIVAIWAIQKKKAQYLNGLFWYYCYVVIYYSLNTLVVVLEPALEEELNDITKLINLRAVEFKILYFVIYLYITALAWYFALVVKSSRDYALRNEAQGDFERPDPIIVGYVNHA